MVRTRSGVGRGQPPVEAGGQGQAPGRGTSRGRGRPRGGGQPHRRLSFASSSAPRIEEEGSPLHEHEHETSSVAPVSAQAQAQTPIPGLQDLIGVISQAVATAVASTPSSQIPREDHEKNYERARKLGAVGFKGTTDPLEAENLFPADRENIHSTEK